MDAGAKRLVVSGTGTGTGRRRSQLRGDYKINTRSLLPQLLATWHPVRRALQHRRGLRDFVLSSAAFLLRVAV